MKNIKKIALTLVTTLSIMGSSMAVLAEDVEQEGTASVPVTVNVDSTFKVSLPASIDVTKANPSKEYEIKVVAGLDPKYKLVVAPVDGYTQEQGDTTTDINLLLKDAYTGEKKKADVLATITAAKTEITADIENLDTTGTTLTHTLSVNPSDLSAGEWKGALNYSISITPIN